MMIIFDISSSYRDNLHTLELVIIISQLDEEAFAEIFMKVGRLVC